MSAPLTVRTGPWASARGAIPAVIASLPVSLAPAAGAAGDIIAIAGDAGWPGRAIDAMRSDIAGVVVVDPIPEQTVALERLAAELRVPVVLDHRWASNAAVPLAAAQVARIPGQVSLVDATAIVGSGERLRPSLEQLALVVRRVTGALEATTLLRDDADGMTASAASGPAHTPTTLSVLRAPEADGLAVRVRIVHAAGDIDLRIPEPGTARPASVTITDARGRIELPTVWESAHRTTWRRLVQLIADGRTPDDLSESAPFFGE